MNGSSKFPLISGHIALDLINTEVIRRGKRIELLVENKDVLTWLNTVQSSIPFYQYKLDDISNQLEKIKSELLTIRSFLRLHFEQIAEQHCINEELIVNLEAIIEKAPHTYKILDERLVIMPIGNVDNMLTSLIALDVLTLINNGTLITIRRCSNDECILLFFDQTGRRKWCSMKICGNRQKVSKFQQRIYE